MILLQGRCVKLGLEHARIKGTALVKNLFFILAVHGEYYDEGEHCPSVYASFFSIGIYDLISEAAFRNLFMTAAAISSLSGIPSTKISCGFLRSSSRNAENNP